jgi:hypothetical protein
VKKNLLAIAALIATSISIVPAWAQDQKSDRDALPSTSVAAAGPKVFHLVGSIVGTVSLTSGGCTQGFSNQCPSGHDCSCFTAMGARFLSTAIGKGSANFFATVDHTAAFGALGADCSPLFGEVDVIAKSDSPTFDVVGGACFDNGNNIVSNGTMGLASSGRFVITGFAAYTATIKFTSMSSGRLVVSLRGAAQ